MKYLGFLLCVFWLMQAWTLINFLRHYKLSDKNKNQPLLDSYPKLSIIVTACNEAEKIGQCLKSLASLHYPEFEIIAVNDRSTDDTGQIMDKLASEYRTIRVLNIAELPENWLGKVHAMHSGAAMASGEFLLFTDGDVIYQPDALEQAIRYSVQQQLDHLCLVPKFIAGNIWENSLVNFSGMIFMMMVRPQAVNSMSSQLYAGVGAFNLVAKHAYQQVGGHETLRLEIVDDMRLGRLLKQHGFKSNLLLADDLLSLKWQTRVTGVIKGLEKNGFAAMDFSWTMLLLFTVIFKLVVFYPYLVLFWLLPSTDSISFAVALLIMHGVYGYCCEKFRPGDWKIAWTLPIAAFFTLIALWNSAVVTWWQGGVKWRGTFYPLEILKKPR